MPQTIVAIFGEEDPIGQLAGCVMMHHSKRQKRQGWSGTVPPSVGGSCPSYSMGPIAKENYVI